MDTIDFRHKKVRQALATLDVAINNFKQFESLQKNQIRIIYQLG